VRAVRVEHPFGNHPKNGFAVAGKESIVLNGAGCLPWDLNITGENEKKATLSKLTHL